MSFSFSDPNISSFTTFISEDFRAVSTKLISLGRLPLFICFYPSLLYCGGFYGKFTADALFLFFCWYCWPMWGSALCGWRGYDGAETSVGPGVGWKSPLTLPQLWLHLWIDLSWSMNLRTKRVSPFSLLSANNHKHQLGKIILLYPRDTPILFTEGTHEKQASY